MKQQQVIIMTFIVVSLLSSCSGNSSKSLETSQSTPRSSLGNENKIAEPENQQNPEVRLIYNAMANFPTRKISSIELNFLKKQILPEVRRVWQDEFDEEKFNIEDMATGSFTQTKKNQNIYLYTCEFDRTAAKQGFVVVEDNRIVAHVVFEGTDRAIGALQDVDRNGIDEILISGGKTNTGSTMDGFMLIELTSNGVRKFGWTETYSDNCGFDDEKDDSRFATAYKIYSSVQTNPVFYRETFIQKGCQGSWKKTRDREIFKLDKCETEFQRLR